MFNELDIFKNTNNKPNRIKSEWQNEVKLKCSFDLQLGLGRKIHWPSSNPVSLLSLIELINQISSWPRNDVQLQLNHYQIGEVTFKTKNESDTIIVSSTNRVLYSGSIPHSEIQKLKLTILNLIVDCQKRLRNKYGEILFKTGNLNLENSRFLYGDKVATLLGQNIKTFKTGHIFQIIKKSTGTKYLLLVDGLVYQKAYSLNELELKETTHNTM